MKKRIFRVTLALFFSLCMLVALPLTSAQAVTAPIVLNPTTASPGDTVTVTGSEFMMWSGATVYIFFDTSNRSSTMVSTGGVLSGFFIVPPAATPGLHEVAVQTIGAYDPGYRIALAYLNVIGEGLIEIDEDEGPVGTEVEISGQDFGDREGLIVEYDGDEIDIEDGDDETDSSGEFEFTIIIPESIAGDHTIRVEDETGNFAEVTFEVVPNIELNITSGSPGTVVQVEGTGFGNREDIDYVEFNGDDVQTTGDDDTDRDGSFDFSFTVPATLGPGTYELVVEDEDGNEAEASFTISVTANIDKASGYVGMTLTITGSGFTPISTVIVTYDGSPVTLGNPNTDVNGSLTTQFDVPKSAAGTHSIVLTVGGYSKAFAFSMESTPPEAPNLLLPLNGEKAKQPITFDWSDVTDDSGVTYILWISNDADFATLVLEETGLTSSSYTMTEAQELLSVGKDTPYYWSVRAVDNASNLGAWATTSFTFNVGFSFDWPEWAWWVVGGVGGLIIILVFFWFGRRSITY